MYTLYEITNLINGMIYRGVHRAKNHNDSYLGSGKYLNNAIEKYGKDKFKKEILFIFKYKKWAYLAERLIVNEEFVARKDTYNLKVGGFGGWSKEANIAATIRRKWLRENDPEYVVRRSKKISDAQLGSKRNEEAKKCMSEAQRGRVVSEETRKNMSKVQLGKHHSEETKKKISKTMKNNKVNVGSKSYAYGLIWIYNPQLKQTKRINPIELQSNLNQGWIRGRYISKENKRKMQIGRKLNVQFRKNTSK